MRRIALEEHAMDDVNIKIQNNDAYARMHVGAAGVANWFFVMAKTDMEVCGWWQYLTLTLTLTLSLTITITLTPTLTLTDMEVISGRQLLCIVPGRICTRCGVV